MATTTWLADKSALARIGSGPDTERWADRIDRGLVRVATVPRLELGYSARSAAELEIILDTIEPMPVQYLTPAIEDRAVEVQRLLAGRGRHRAPSIPDLLIAAAGELSDLVILHVDKDFELIAEITGQPVERLRTEDA